jgi:SAM-dependent methyltransferase
VIQVVRQRLDPLFMPRRMLDFGCGVGRVLLPASRFVQRAVGVDVSASMLAEARRNCERDQLGNVELLQQGGVDGLPKASFDLVHSAIVLQHIDVERGTRLFGDLVALVGPNGVGAIQVTYSKSQYAAELGVPPLPVQAPAPTEKGLLRSLRKTAARPAPEADPVMQMNPYPLTPVFFQLQAAGIRNTYVEFTDHGGELGLFFFFQRA